MKSCILTTLLLLSSSLLKSQDILSIKTDSDCLKFITTVIDGEQDFYFDTIVSTSPPGKLNLNFKSWGIFDFNGDQKPDLYYTGRYKNDWTHWASSSLYLSEGKSYKRISLLRRNNGQYFPVVFPQKQLTKQLLFVYLFDFDNRTKVDSLVQKRVGLYPGGIRVIDTLIYKYDAVINYSRQPSNLNFDSLTYKVNYSQTCRNDSFTVYKNGIIKYAYVWCGRVEFEKFLTIDPGKFDMLKGLIKEINTSLTNTDYSTTTTDRSSAELKIFTGNSMILFSDYGMESTFTLKAIYSFFSSLDPNKVE